MRKGNPIFGFLLTLCCFWQQQQQCQCFVVPQQKQGRTSKLFPLFDEKAPKHDTKGQSFQDLPQDIQSKIMAYQQYQESCPKLSWPVEVRTLVEYNHGFAVISTHSKANPGYPGGSVVGFAPDERGNPLFVFSGMSTHTQDILVDPRCSLTVASKEFKGAADGRVNLLGTCHLIRDPLLVDNAKKIYLKKHPGAFWADFGDFNWFRLDVEQVRFVGGFARAGRISAQEYRDAQPDSVAQFSPDISRHMNEDHMEATMAMIQALVPSLERDDTNPMEEALITSIDSLGMYVKVTRKEAVAFLPKSFKLRLPFPRQAQNRQDVRVLIKEMAQASSNVGQ